jgi:hypothetical protein
MSEVRTADGRVLTAAEMVAHEAIAHRLSWASLHWGTERVSPEAWPHIAIAVSAAIREQIAAEIEAATPDGKRSQAFCAGMDRAARIARGATS